MEGFEAYFEVLYSHICQLLCVCLLDPSNHGLLGLERILIIRITIQVFNPRFLKSSRWKDGLEHKTGTPTGAKNTLGRVDPQRKIRFRTSTGKPEDGSNIL